MNLWVLRSINGWEEVYDVADNFVIRAETEQEARNLATGECGDEGPDVWRNPELVSCTKLIAEGAEKIIMIDFHHDT